ncbi:hypothetical protein C7S16_4647 [Burkholderia thailandensis]|uniref:Uncharacterized protein n=2 Tax=Burkholderia thailandensis TaxID=57975 RepID=A0AAW9CWD6_BURTH|nr:hypothetical protein BTH_II1682 [Burkholderia thailandensis E264]MDW9236036.1 hypothetical protein [Burkholderia thailandensis]MDW9253423.1 hypothetical protein [Burkholderia thailandensis]
MPKAAARAARRVFIVEGGPKTLSGRISASERIGIAGVSSRELD